MSSTSPRADAVVVQGDTLGILAFYEAAGFASDVTPDDHTLWSFRYGGCAVFSSEGAGSK